MDTQTATIRITFKASDGSWSALGTDCKKEEWFRKNEATMNLGWILQGQANAKENKGVILHEFGHALGLDHEHQSPARGGKITLNRDG